MAVNCILNIGSQRSYFSSNITYLKPSKEQIKEVRLPLNTYTSRSTKNFQLVKLEIGFGDGKETTRPVLVDKEFNIPYQFPRLRSFEKNLKERNSKFASTFRWHNNKMKISGLICADLIERMNNLKIIDCMMGKAWLTPTWVALFVNCNNFLFNKQKSIANWPPPNTLLNYYTVLSKHSHCPENYVREELDVRDELLDSEEAVNASQINTNLQNMFAIDTAAADGSELDISGYKKKKKRIWELHWVQRQLLLSRPFFDWKPSK